MKWAACGTTRSGREILQFTMTEAEYFCLDEQYVGLCILCGAERDCCEPDMRAEACECCERRGVYGVQELLLRGLVRFPDGDCLDGPDYDSYNGAP